MRNEQIREKIDSFPYWHFEFDLYGNLTRKKSYRQAWRKEYFFDPLVGLLGGSLEKKRILDLACNAGFWSLCSTEAGCDYVLGIDGRQMHIEQANFVFEVKEVEKSRYDFVAGDIFATDFSKADVITMYLLPALNMKLRPQILSMKPGTRVASHSFTMEDWEADEISSMDGRRAYFWIVPANVMGAWSLEAGGRQSELQLEQTFQKIKGTVAFGTTHGGLREPRLRGAQISFSYVDPSALRRDFTGRVNGTRMEGTFRDEKGQEGRWTATKK